MARASLTCLSSRLRDLESEAGELKTLKLAQRMSQKLSDLDSKFQTQHHALIDLIDDNESPTKQQEVLDSHDDLIAELGVRVTQVIAASTPSSVKSTRRIASCKLSHLHKSLSAIMSIDSTAASSSKVNGGVPKSKWWVGFAKGWLLGLTWER